MTDLGPSPGSQHAPMSRLFPPGTVPDSLVKGEQGPLHGGIAQVPATGASDSALRLDRLGPREWSRGPAAGLGRLLRVPGRGLGCQARQ